MLPADTRTAESQPDFVGRLFKAWSWIGLAEAHQGEPEKARGYLRKIIESGYGCEMAADAERKLRELDGG